MALKMWSIFSPSPAENSSSIEVKFLDDTDYETQYDELRFRVLNIQKQLPQGADDPTFNLCGHQNVDPGDRGQSHGGSQQPHLDSAGRRTEK